MKSTNKPDWWLAGYPWASLGEEIGGGNAYDTLNDLARDGERLIEPGQRVKCYLRRLTALEHETLTAGGITEARHAGVALWTEDQDHPQDFEDRIQLLEEDDVARIERNSLSVALRTAANAYQNAADAGLHAESPAGRLIDLVVARHQ